AVVLLGKGLHALQTLGVMPLWPVPLVEVEPLGIYPDLYSFGAQLILAAAPALWFWWRRKGVGLSQPSVDGGSGELPAKQAGATAAGRGYEGAGAFFSPLTGAPPRRAPSAARTPRASGFDPPRAPTACGSGRSPPPRAAAILEVSRRCCGAAFRGACRSSAKDV